MNISQPLDLAVAVSPAGHHMSVAPTTGQLVGVAPVSLPNYLGGAAILVLLAAMLRVSLSAAGLNKKQSTGYQQRFNSSARSVHHH